jgi:hypothetical protein
MLRKLHAGLGDWVQRVCMGRAVKDMVAAIFRTLRKRYLLREEQATNPLHRGLLYNTL